MFKLVIANEIFSEATLSTNVLQNQNNELANFIINYIKTYPQKIFGKQYNFKVCISDDIQHFSTFVYEQDYIGKSSSSCILSRKDYVSTQIKDIPSVIIKTLHCVQTINKQDINVLTLSVYLCKDNISLRELQYNFEKSLSINSKTKRD